MSGERGSGAQLEGADPGPPALSAEWSASPHTVAPSRNPTWGAGSLRDGNLFRQPAETQRGGVRSPESPGSLKGRLGHLLKVRGTRSGRRHCIVPAARRGHLQSVQPPHPGAGDKPDTCAVVISGVSPLECDDFGRGFGGGQPPLA